MPPNSDRLRPFLLLAFALAGGMGLLMTGVALVAFRSSVSGFTTSTAERAYRLALVERLFAVSERIGRAGRALAALPSEPLHEDLTEARTEFRVLLRELAAHPMEESAVVERVRTDHGQYLKALDNLLRGVRDNSSPANEIVADLLDRRQTLNVSLEELRAATVRQLQRAQDGALTSLVRTFHLLLVGAAVAYAVIVGLGMILIRALRRLETKGKALAGANDELRAVNADLDAFAGRVAHDLRNLLTPLDLALGAVESKVGDQTAIVRHVQRAQRASRRAQALIRDLLEFARAGRSVQAGARASVRQAVEEVTSELESLREQVDATVTVDVQDMAVACPPALLQAVIANLVGNALKFLAGHSRRQVTIRGIAEAELASIEVADTGPGIPAESRDKVFRAFFRSVEVRQPGTGLGLAIVQRIVDAHGGRVELLPSSMGCRFRVQLPLAALPDASGAPVIAGRAAAEFGATRLHS